MGSNTLQRFLKLTEFENPIVKAGRMISVIVEIKFQRNKRLLFKNTSANMELFLALVSRFQPLINFTKNPNRGAIGVLNAPLEYCNVFCNLLTKLSIAELQPATFLKIIYFTS